jgi:dephospho-CoA kinase
VLEQPAQMALLEAIVHPLVAAHRQEFLTKARAQGERLVLLDIPLLFETGADRELDAVIVVTAPFAVQSERVLARPGMTLEKFAVILARQMPDIEKRRRADFVIDTSKGISAVEQEVRQIVRILSDRHKN